MELKIGIAVLVIAVYLVTWAKWFIKLLKAKREFDEQSRLTKSTMQQAFEETRKLQARIDERRN